MTRRRAGHSGASRAPGCKNRKSFSPTFGANTLDYPQTTVVHHTPSEKLVSTTRPLQPAKLQAIGETYRPPKCRNTSYDRASSTPLELQKTNEYLGGGSPFPTRVTPPDAKPDRAATATVAVVFPNTLACYLRWRGEAGSDATPLATLRTTRFNDQKGFGKTAVNLSVGPSGREQLRGKG